MPSHLNCISNLYHKYLHLSVQIHHETTNPSVIIHAPKCSHPRHVSARTLASPARTRPDIADMQHASFTGSLSKNTQSEALFRRPPSRNKRLYKYDRKQNSLEDRGEACFFFVFLVFFSSRDWIPHLVKKCKTIGGVCQKEKGSARGFGGVCVCHTG